MNSPLPPKSIRRHHNLSIRLLHNSCGSSRREWRGRIDRLRVFEGGGKKGGMTKVYGLVLRDLDLDQSRFSLRASLDTQMNDRYLLHLFANLTPLQSRSKSIVQHPFRPLVPPLPAVPKDSHYQFETSNSWLVIVENSSECCKG